MPEKETLWGNNLLHIKRYLNKHLRVEELKRADSFDEMLWMLLSGIVCSDGLALKRAVLFLEKEGVLRGKLGIGPLNKEDEIEQNTIWNAHEKDWVFKEISSRKDDPCIKSNKMNNILQQITFSQEESRFIYDLTIKSQIGKDTENDNDFFDNKQIQAMIIDVNEAWDAQIAPFFTRLHEKLYMKLFILAPLISGDKLVGLLLADDLDTPPDTIKSQEIKNQLNQKLSDFSYFVNQVAIAHEMRNLITGWKELVSSLTKIHKSITQQKKNMSDLLNDIITEATKLTRGTGGILFLKIKSKDTEKHLRVAMTHKMDPFQNMHLKENEGAAGIAANIKKGYVIHDYPLSPEHCKQTDHEPLKGMIQAVVAVPLLVEDNVIGVIDVCSSVPEHKFSPQDIELLEMFAPIAASIIDDNRQSVQLRALFDALPLPLILADKAGVIERSNREANDLFGLETAKTLHMKDIYLNGDNEAKKIRDLLNDAQKGKITVRTVVLNKKTGNKIPIQLSAASLVDDLGENLGSLGIMESLASRDEKAKMYLHQQMVLRDLHAFQPDLPINSRSELRCYLKDFLRKANLELQCQWLVCFGSRAEDETVLEAVAWLGISDDEKMPHFNWRKAKISELARDSQTDSQTESNLIAQWTPTNKWRGIIDKGLLGENRGILKDFSLGIPVRLAQGLRGVLLLGPPKTASNEVRPPILSEMSDFIRSSAGAICAHALSLLQEINLKEQNEVNKQINKFIVHRARTSLLPITGAFDAIRRKYGNKERVFEICDIGEDSSIKLYEQVDNVFKSGISELSIRDIKLEKRSLATLVLNCISLFEIRARDIEREIKADDSLENLPTAMIDRIQLSVAIGNILDNAIKYSAKGFYVNVTSEIEFQSMKAKIIIHNIGYEMPDKARDNFKKPGGRYAKNSEDKDPIPGTGFGLYEASKIIRYHKGTMDFSSMMKRQGEGFYHTRIILTIPIKL